MCLKFKFLKGGILAYHVFLVQCYAYVRKQESKLPIMYSWYNAMIYGKKLRPRPFA